MSITRRAALSLGLGGLAAPFLTRRPPAFAQAGQPLPIPALLEPDAAGMVRLKLAEGRHAFAPGHSVASAGVNGPYLGPVVRLKTGSEATLAVDNALPWTTTVHWHGLHVPSDADGGPFNAIAPGANWSPRIVVKQPPALTWFHPHPHGDTARQAHIGLAGALVVADGRDRERGLPDAYGVDDLPLVLQDKRVLDGDQPYAPDAMDFMHGFRGPHIVVNGALDPVATAPAAIVRLRFLNAANARNFILRFADGRPLHVIASDGGFLAKPVAVDTLVVAPGERYEALVDFSDGRAVDLLTDPDDNGRFGSGMMERMKAMASGLMAEPQKVMAFVPDAGIKGGIAALPTGFDDPGPVDASVAVRRRDFLMDERMMENMQAMMGGMPMQNGGGMMMNHGGEGMMMQGGPMDHSAHMGRSAEQAGPAGTAHSLGIAMAIAGAPYAMDRIDVEARLGSHEVWGLTTQEMAHPFHIHGASFRVLSLNGAPTPAHQAGWKDVALVPGKAEMLVRFDRPATRDRPFMFHCHILEHEEAGMMGQFMTV